MSDTPQSRELGHQLRAWRKRAGLSQEAIASELGVKQAAVSRWESGKRLPDGDYLERYLRLCGASDAEVEEHVNFAGFADDAVWVSFRATKDQNRILSALLRTEDSADRITYMASSVVPGLVQTSGYARALMEAAHLPDDMIRKRVNDRMGRGQIIRRKESPVELDILLDESVIHLRVGSDAVMAEQLRHLVECGALPTVNIQIVPLSAGWTPARDGQFNIIDPISSDEATPLVYREMYDTTMFFSDPEDVEGIYRIAINETRQKSLSPEESAALMTKEIEKLEKVQ